MDLPAGQKKLRLEYDAQGRLTKTVSHKDDGSRWGKIYEPDSALGTAKPRSETFYDALGVMYKSVTTLDDGSLQEIFYDLSSALGSTKPRWESAYDSKGRKVKTVQNEHDGSRWEGVYEPDGALGTAKPRSETFYDSQGRLYKTVTNLDDGSYRHVYFELSGPLGSTKPRWLGNHDAQGREVKMVRNDYDGTRWEWSYEPDSRLGSAKPRWERNYDVQGREIKTLRNEDDGSRWEGIYEPDGALGTSKPRSENVYDSEGRKIRGIAHNDDGSRWEGHYDAKGRLTYAVTDRADGIRWENVYEVDSALGTSKPRFERTYDAAGRMTAANMNSDDGRQISTLNPPTFPSFSYTPPPPQFNSAARDWSSSIGNVRNGNSVNLPSIAPIPTPRPRGGGLGFDGGNVNLPSTAPIPTPNPRSGRGGSGRPSGGVSVGFPKTGEWSGPNNPFLMYPVALDLDNDGMVEIRQLSPEPLIDQAQESDAASSQPRFDWNDDGTGEDTAWVGSEDGLLAIDLSADGSAGADGKINQAREIAFAQWKTEDEIASENAAEDQSAARSAITDLEGLRRVFDTNHDDVLDAQDARWREFRIWQDANQDGVSDPGELRSLDQAGIKLLHLLPSPEDAQAFADGSSISGTSHFERGDGKRGLVADVSLAYRPNDLASNAA